MVISIDSSVLLAYYDAKAGIANASTSASATATTGAASTGPTYTGTAPTVGTLTSAVLAGGAFVNPSSVKLTGTVASPVTSDDKNLFAVYQGLTALQGLAQQASATNVSSAQQSTLETTFARGLGEVQNFLGAQPFTKLTVADGAVSATAKSTAGVPSPSYDYTTSAIATGSSSDVVPGFAGTVQFSAAITNLSGTTKTVGFDLADMGSTPRTLDNVINYLNGQLSAAGVSTRFGFVRTPGATTFGVTAPDSFALQVQGAFGESVSFSAATTTPAVYVAQSSGTTAATAASNALSGDTQDSTADAVQQIVKLDGGSAASNAPAIAGDVLPTGVSGIQASATAADGSLYVLANLSGPAPDGQTIKGAGDVALLKYDSAGNLAYARTLGASDTASGYALALSADGTQVAVAGSVTGPLSGADPAGLDPAVSSTTPSGFVAVYGTQSGDEQWTQRTTSGAASGVAFGSDGGVYVTSDTAASASTLQQGYLQSFTSSTQTNFDGSTTTSVAASAAVPLGASGDIISGVVATPDGGVITASVENGHAILSRYDAPLGPDAVPTQVRDLGDLGGGSIAGITLAADGSIVVAGSTDSGDLSAGTVTTGYVGGQQAFVASVAADLTASASDRLSYLDTGSGDATASALTVSGGQVYVTGSVDGAPTAGSKGADTQTGFVLAVDPTSGAVGWSNSLTGVDAQSAPTTIAVASAGASALDKLGLPQGAIGSGTDQNLVATTSARAGDQFYVRSGGGTAQAITLSADDTLTTLAAKVTSALGYNGTASVVTSLNGPSYLQITPTSFRSVELEAGPTGADALASLGLTAGLVTTKATPTSAQKAASNTATPYALDLGSSLDISTTLGAKAAQGVLTKALATVQQAYSDMNSPLKATTTTAATSAAPAYITAQIADYQLALSRLTAYNASNSDSSGSSTDPSALDLSSLF